jgi:hypothetical protein
LAGVSVQLCFGEVGRFLDCFESKASPSPEMVLAGLFNELLMPGYRLLIQSICYLAVLVLVLVLVELRKNRYQPFLQKLLYLVAIGINGVGSMGSETLIFGH